MSNETLREGGVVSKKQNGNGLILVATASTLVVVLSTFFFLNYFNVLSLSQVFPRQLGWLPHQQTPRTVTIDKNQKNKQPQEKIVEGPRVFEPSLNPTEEEGQLVDRYIIAYHLYGKIRRIEPLSQGEKYLVTIVSIDGSQEYQMKDVGNDDLRTNRKEGGVQWTDLKPGDEVMVDVSAIKDSKKSTIITSIDQVIVVVSSAVKQ